MKKTMHNSWQHVLIAALFVTSITSHAGDITVDGDLFVDSNLTISGTAQFSSNVTMAQNVTISGTSTLYSVLVPKNVYTSQRILFSYGVASDRTNYIYSDSSGNLIFEKGTIHAVGNYYTEALTLGNSSYSRPIRWYWYQPPYGQIEAKFYPNTSGEAVWENVAKGNTSKLVCEGAASVSLGGNLTVQNNLTVFGKTYITYVQPMGDIAMGIYTNTP